MYSAHEGTEVLPSRNHIKLWIGAAVFLTAVLACASTLLRPGVTLACISDIVAAFLMFSAFLAFAPNAAASTGRIRLFWTLQAAGWAMWLSYQLVWLVFDLVIQKKVPAM